MAAKDRQRLKRRSLPAGIIIWANTGLDRASLCKTCNQKLFRRIRFANQIIYYGNTPSHQHQIENQQ